MNATAGGLIPISIEDQTKVNEAFKLLQSMLANLYFRWQDECQYEDFKEYSDAMKTRVEAAGVVFKRASKKPFGFYFSVGSDAEYLMSINSKYISWKRTA